MANQRLYNSYQPPPYSDTASSLSESSESESSSDHQLIANRILQEATQTEGGRVFIPDIDLSSYEHIAALVSERAPGRLRYYYDVHNLTIIVDRLEFAIHESLSTALARLQDSLEEWLRAELGLRARVWLSGTQGLDMFDASGVRVKGKCPDQSYRVLVLGRCSEHGDIEEEEGDEDLAPEVCWRYYPSIITEIGYSETYEQLVEDGRLWLLYSPRHSVLSFILFNFEKPKNPQDFNNFAEWTLFFEVWKR